jgi:hypothetical protein
VKYKNECTQFNDLWESLKLVDHLFESDLLSFNAQVSLLRNDKAISELCKELLDSFLTQSPLSNKRKFEGET